MSIVNSRESGVQALVRKGRHGLNRLNWKQPFVATLHVQNDRSGKPCVLALNDVNFADSDPRHSHESPTLLTSEGYALEILELPVGTKL